MSVLRMWALVTCALAWAAWLVASGMFGWSAETVLLANIVGIWVAVSACALIARKHLKGLL